MSSLRRFLTVVVAGYFLLVILASLGAEAALLEPLRSVYGLAVMILGIVFVMRFRTRFRTSEADPDPDAPKVAAFPRVVLSILGRSWWIAAILYLLGVYAVWMSDIENGLERTLSATGLSVLAVAGGALLIALIRMGVPWLEARVSAWANEIPRFKTQLPRYFVPLRWILETTVIVVTASVVLESWGFAALAFLGSAFMASLLETTLKVLFTVFLAFAVIDVATALTQRFLSTKKRRGRDTAKVRTLVPLVEKAIRILVVIVAGIMILGELGVDIAPLLAGVGVLGLAVGFGAQSLVKDIITGTFILLEDSISVGDVVSLDGTGGLVEQINIRTLTLRDVDGNVHVIPYSTVGKITNMTKGFSRCVIDAGVAYDSDVDQVIEVLKQVAEDLRKHPDHGPKILEPLEVFGLDRFQDSSMVVRVRLTTKPMQQWSIKREFQRRMKRAFDEHGIKIPFPHRHLVIDRDDLKGAVVGIAPPVQNDPASKPD